jgi:hypothetical protein
LEESAGLKVKTSRPTAWNGIIKSAPEPEWAKLTGVFTLNHKSRFDPRRARHSVVEDGVGDAFGGNIMDFYDELFVIDLFGRG